MSLNIDRVIVVAGAEVADREGVKLPCLRHACGAIGAVHRGPFCLWVTVKKRKVDAVEQRVDVQESVRLTFALDVR